MNKWGCHGGQLVSGSRFGLRGRYISSIPGIAAFSGDPGFAWIAFPVKLRVGSSGVVGWPWSWVPHSVSTGVPRSRHTNPFRSLSKLYSSAWDVGEHCGPSITKLTEMVSQGVPWFICSLTISLRQPEYQHLGLLPAMSSSGGHYLCLVGTLQWGNSSADDDH